MLYAILPFKKLGSIQEPKCVFCKKPVNMSDFYLMCRKHGLYYNKIPKFWQIVLPKFIIRWLLLID